MKKLHKVVKFCCNFDAIVTSKGQIANRDLTRQIIAMCLLLLFCTFQYIQHHHHHGQITVKAGNDKSTNIHPKCDICDFVAKKQNSYLEHSDIGVPAVATLPLSSIGFHYQTNWYFAYAILTDNKGPPSSI